LFENVRTGVGAHFLVESTRPGFVPSISSRLGQNQFPVDDISLDAVTERLDYFDKMIGNLSESAPSNK